MAVDTGLHGNSTGVNVHTPIRWIYDDAADRGAATGFTPDDVNKFALQTDDDSIWRLKDDSPITWVPVGSGDMTKADYDSDADGTVDAAETAWDLDIGSLSPGVPASGDLIVFESGGVRFSADVDDLPGGGGGGTVINDRRWVRGSAAHAQDDEFNNASLAVAWSRVDAVGGTGRATWTEAGDSLSLLLAGGDAAAETHAMVRPYALSIGESIQCHITGLGKMSSYPNAGLVIANGNTYGSGVQAAMLYFLANSAEFSMSCANYAGYNTRSSFTDVISKFFSTQVHIRLEYSASNQFKYYVSPDGISWILIDTRSITFTPSHIGVIGGTYGGSEKFIFSFDYFRVF